MTKPVVCIGTEPMQWVPALVLAYSVARKTELDLDFVFSWTPQTGWHPHFRALPKLRSGTGFNTFRWVVPKVCERRGRALYLDADQVCLADVNELFKFPMAGRQIAVVWDAEGVFGDKVPEPSTPQTSVMVMDCQLCEWDAAKLVSRSAKGGFGKFYNKTHGRNARSDYAALMQAAWLHDSQIGRLDPTWNHFGIVRDDTKLVHWSHVADQPYRNPDHPTSGVFSKELACAVFEGVIGVELVAQEVLAGHLDKHWLGVAEVADDAKKRHEAGKAG